MKDTLLKALQRFMPILLSLWVLVSLADVVAYFCYDLVGFGFYYALHGYTFAFIIALACSVAPRIIRRVLFVLFYTLGVINVIADVVVQYTFHTRFTNDMVEIVRATNLDEASEFARTFFNAKIVLFCVIICVVCVGAYLIADRVVSSHTKVLIPAFTVSFALFVFAIVSTSIKHSTNWGGVYLNKVVLFLQSPNDESNDLTSFRHELCLSEPSEELPKTIVIIIGESHSSRHSSLYGYDKETAPLLAKREVNGELHIYKSVQSPETQTQGSFKRILNSYLADSQNGIVEKWNESKTIFDLARALGYKTIWLSNQSPKGIYDNIPTRFSELCDTALFAGSAFMVAGRMQQDGCYDENVLELRKRLSLESSEKCLFVTHLLGSHYTFEYRYPKTFQRYKPEDYPSRKESQREQLAHYDNSLLYNDYVVDEIIKTVENDDSIVFYFSDHSLDLFDSSDSYIGHARGDEKSIAAGKSVPFYIYVSPSLAKKNPDITNRISEREDLPFNTGFFYNELETVLGVMENSR